ncbi:MAG: DUF11 domain-containing protein [Bacteroidetes bacterium]|nr:DUF11 domain-containing protein [Bacteroidota bacterium]
MYKYKMAATTTIWLLALGSAFAQSPPENAIEYVSRHCKEWGLSEADVSSLVVTSWHVSSTSGLTHIYLQQQIDGIPVLPSVASVHFAPTGEVFHYSDQLVADLQERITSKSISLSASQAAGNAAANLGIAPEPSFVEQTKKGYELDSDGHLRLCWEVVLPHNEDVWVVRIDAETGKELNKYNRTLHCQFDRKSNQKQTHSPLFFSPKTAHTYNPTGSDLPSISFDGQYNIFPYPTESPLYGTRSLKQGIDIIEPTASPYGWHDIDNVAPTPDYEYTRGNNVYAFYAPIGTPSIPIPVCITRLSGIYVPGGIVPCSPSLDFNFTNSLNSAIGTDFIEDAVTNLFVWNNICHDVYYLYGFDEAAGNFQETNDSGIGTGGDYVLARAQDGSGLNNASFSTPPEPPGASAPNPIMRMFLWDTDFPNSVKDGDFDSAIMAHEYGHGVSFRLVGGAANVNCLNSAEQGGEGWSDFFGLMLTLEDKDGDNILEEDVMGEGIRSIGAYVLAEAANGEGIRPAYYTTNMNSATANYNDYTYGDLPNMAYPHGTGFIWCTMLWDMTWQLINAYGFEPDIYNTSSTAGNIRAMKIVVEGLKLTDCNPTFPQMRDAILAANDAIYGGAGNNLIWEAFARRGLGYSATAGGNEAFDNPTMQVIKTVDKSEVEVDESVTYTISVKNNSQAPLTNVDISDPISPNLNVTAISDGGSLQGNTVVYPTIASIPVGDSESRTFTGTINASNWTTTELDEPIEVVLPNGFVPASTWITDCDNPNPATGSTRCWWHLDPVVESDASLTLTLNLDGTKNNHLSFWQWFDVEAGVDGGVLEIWNGSTWDDLDSRIIKNSYNNILLAALPTPIGVPVPLSPLNGRRAYSGYSGGYVNTIVDLSGLNGSQMLRFRFGANTGLQDCTVNGPASGTACEGWYLDDFKLFDLKHLLNTANVTSAQGYSESGNVGLVGTVYFEELALPVELVWFNAKAHESDILLEWETASEQNNAGFELQRRSEFETDFEKIAWIPSLGNTSQESTDYHFLDKNVAPNVVYYYRLRQLDMDGTEKMSDVVFASLLSGDGQRVCVYPNPVAGDATLKFGRLTADRVSLHLLNSQGQVLKTEVLEAGEVSYPVHLSDIPSGIYMLQIVEGTKFYYQKIIIP